MFYFTSDTHFDDEEAIFLDNRPYKTAKDFEKDTLRKWNMQVKGEDIIYIVGDFVSCKGPKDVRWKKSLKLVKKIKAQVVLISGNNEERIVSNFFDGDYQRFKEYCISLGFKDCLKSTIVSFNSKDYFLIHKPKHYKENAFNLFGHTHRSCGIWKSFGLCVCCDLNHFYLYSEQDINNMETMKSKYWDKDENVKIQ